MAVPLALYSAITRLAYSLGQNHYRQRHSVWCANQPAADRLVLRNSASSDRPSNSWRFQRDIVDGDEHSALIETNRERLLRGVAAKQKEGMIDLSTHQHIKRTLRRARIKHGRYENRSEALMRWRGRSVRIEATRRNCTRWRGFLPRNGVCSLMPLTDDEIREEYQRRMDQMAVNIEKMRADMDAQTKQLAWENRKFFVSIVLAFAATLGAGAAIGNYLARHEPPQAVYQLPPGTVITTPGPIVVAPAAPPK